MPEASTTVDIGAAAFGQIGYGAEKPVAPSVAAIGRKQPMAEIAVLAHRRLPPNEKNSSKTRILAVREVRR